MHDEPGAAFLGLFHFIFYRLFLCVLARAWMGYEVPDVTGNFIVRMFDWLDLGEKCERMNNHDQLPNQSRGCVKTLVKKIGNDQIFDMANFDEMSWRIQWSENEFSHSLAPEPTWLGASDLRLSVLLRHVTVPTRLSFFR